jgi:molybdopterin converting factor small subunit
MEIECVFFGQVRDAAGFRRTVQTVEDGTTVAELIGGLIAENEGLEEAISTDGGDLRRDLVVTVNGQHIHYLNEGSTVLSDGDVVRMTRSIQGGSG